MLNKLKEMTNTGGNLVNLGRTLQTRNKPLYDWILTNTQFLPQNCKFNERVYCLVNNITDIPLCPITGKELRFRNYFKGYANSAGDISNPVAKEHAQPLTPEEISDVKIRACDMIKNPSGFKRKEYQLYCSIVAHTNFLRDDVSFAERLYCLLHGISEPKTVPFKSFNVGYGVANTAAENDRLFLEAAARVGSTSREHGAKILGMLRDNQDKASSLYELPESELNINFLVCPLLGIRKQEIRSDYIENYLLMTVNEFKRKFPNQLLVCKGLSTNIKSGLHATGEDGKTGHERSVVKTQAILSTVDANGLTGHQKLGQKTRNTHLNNINEKGQNGYQQQVEARLTTFLPNGFTVEQNAHRKKEETESKNGVKRYGASKQSKKALAPVLDWLNVHHLFHWFDQDEWRLQCSQTKRVLFYDLTIPDLNLVVEYHSSAYHPNPFVLTEEEWSNWSPRFPSGTDNRFMQNDLFKAKAIWLNMKYVTFPVWERTQNTDVEALMEYLECLLEIKNMRS